MLTTSGVRRAAMVLLTLAAGSAGGLLFNALGLPAAWISGSLVLTIVLAVAGVPVALPESFRFVAFVILGTSMGTVLTPEMLAHASNWPVSMALLAVSVTLTMAGSILFLTRIAKWDLQSAFYASAPGAFGTVMAMAEDTDADIRKVAFAQSLRLFLLVAALPNVLGVLGFAAPGLAPPLPAESIPEVATLLGASTVASLLAAWARVPGGLILGALAMSAALHMTGLSSAHVPNVLVLPAFVVLGIGVGTRFLGTTFSTIRSYFAAALSSFLVAFAISAAFAMLASRITGDDPGKLVTAFAPGALEAMTALGFALGYDPAFMSAHHLFRFAGLSVALPVAAHLMFSIGRAGSSRDDGPPMA